VESQFTEGPGAPSPYSSGASSQHSGIRAQDSFIWIICCRLTRSSVGHPWLEHETVARAQSSIPGQRDPSYLLQRSLCHAPLAHPRQSQTIHAELLPKFHQAVFLATNSGGPHIRRDAPLVDCGGVPDCRPAPRFSASWPGPTRSLCFIRDQRRLGNVAS
jgi:hypothetical protein